MKTIFTLLIYTATCTACWAIAPMGSGENDYVFVGMSGFSDAGPRSPSNIDWFQLDASDNVIDQRRLFRTDDLIWGVAASEQTVDGYVQFYLAVTRERVHEARLVRVSVDRYGLFGRQIPLMESRKGGQFTDVALYDIDGDGKDNLLSVWVSESGDSSIYCWDLLEPGKISNEQVLTTFSGAVIEAIAPGIARNTLEVVIKEPDGCRLVRVFFGAPDGGARQKDLGLIVTPEIGRVHGLSRDGTSLLVAIRRVRYEGEVAVVPEVEYQGVMVGPDVASLDSMEMSHVCRLSRQGEGYGDPVLIPSLMPGRQWATAITKLPKIQEDDRRFDIDKINPNSNTVIYIEGLTGHYFNIDSLESFGLELSKGWVVRNKNTTIPPAYKFKLEEIKNARAVVIADAPLWAFTYSQVALLDAYVRHGGILVFCEGPMTGSAGGYTASTLADLLPSDLGPTFSVIPLQSPQSVDPIGRVRYVKAVGPVKSRARVLAEADGRPVLIERYVGRGRILQVAALPLGKNDDGQPDFWQSEAWIQWLAAWIKKGQVRE